MNATYHKKLGYISQMNEPYVTVTGELSVIVSSPSHLSSPTNFDESCIHVQPRSINTSKKYSRDLGASMVGVYYLLARSYIIPEPVSDLIPEPLLQAEPDLLFIVVSSHCVIYTLWGLVLYDAQHIIGDSQGTSNDTKGNCY